jgi:hypothetical protein
MEDTSRNEFKWFWAWQDHKEEEWLRNMAQQGWHLKTLTLPAFYTFTRGEPRNDVYRLDFITSKEDFGAYLQLFQDMGWEHVGTMSGWQYFRKNCPSDATSEIYTDAESKIEKYRRLFGFLLIFLPIWVAMLTSDPGGSYPPLRVAYKLLTVTLMALWGYAFLRIGLRIKELKRI